MKYLVYSLLALSISFSSCDKCKDVDCVNGDCNKGNCDCYPWYEGERCEDEMREKFYARYDGTLTIDGESEPAYTILSEAGNELNKVDWGGSYILLTSSTEFTIPEQLITYEDAIFVLRGSGGTLKFDQLTIDFSYSFQGTTFYFHFTGYSNKRTEIQENDIIWDEIREYILR
jgi:hypothetical protein